MDWWSHLVVFVTTITHVMGNNVGAIKSVSACFGEPTIKLECGWGYMVRIMKTFYGYSHNGHCSFQDGDCKLVELEHYPCIGSRKCVINLPSGKVGKRIPGCNQRSTYFQADYMCIKASDVINICKVSEVTTQSGYIMTPHYPLNYPNNKKCSLTIRGRPTQTWTIWALDVHLPGTSEKGCDDKLYLFDSFKPTTLCGTRWNDIIFRTWINNTSIKVEFTSNSETQQKGFWLYFEAQPLLPTTTPIPPTTPPKVTADGETTAGPSGGLTVNTVDDGKADRVKLRTSVLPAAAIIGGVIGGLLLILASLVILLLVKRIREKKQLQASRTDLNLNRNVSNPPQTPIQNNMCSPTDNNPCADGMAMSTLNQQGIYPTVIVT